MPQNAVPYPLASNCKGNFAAEAQASRQINRTSAEFCKCFIYVCAASVKWQIGARTVESGINHRISDTLLPSRMEDRATLASDPSANPEAGIGLLYLYSGPCLLTFVSRHQALNAGVRGGAPGMNFVYTSC